MSIEGIIISIVLFVAAALVVVFPLLRGADRGAASAANADAQLAAKQRERLTLYYERALRNIRDLDEDHALGKLEDDIYRADRELWVQRGVQALRAIDQIDAQQRTAIVDTTTEDAAVDRAIDDAIEVAVRSYRERVH